MKIYTKIGDRGTTSLVGGERVAKDDPRVDAYGNVDELTAVLAYLRDNMDAQEVFLEEFREDLRTVMIDLMAVAALLASGDIAQTKVADIDDSRIKFLESRIDYLDLQLQPLTQFIIPGGDKLVSWAHVCRTVCRRSERSAVRAAAEFDISDNAIIYLNRLSDYLYLLSRSLSRELGAAEEFWEPGM